MTSGKMRPKGSSFLVAKLMVNMFDLDKEEN